MGVEPAPVVGHLDAGEPMMKPHFVKCGLLLMKGGDSCKDYKDNPEDLPLCLRSTGDKAILKRKEKGK